MNRREWIVILIACAACLLNGGAQPIFALLIANIITVITDFFIIFCNTKPSLFGFLLWSLYFLAIQRL